jgi:CubicO group peptidase (beta-lactamase class C family)
VKIEPDAAGMDEGRLERITSHFESTYVDTQKIAGCQITVVRGGHVAYHRSLGLMDREQQTRMADDTIFRIYSMTKPIASVALMQLYEQGMFQLLDPVHRYIPEWRTQKVGLVGDDGAVTLVKPERPMNMRDVLMHMTGLPGGLYPGNPIDDAFNEARAELARPQTLESVTALLAEHPLKFHPGTHWNYGISTDIVGRLVEILSGVRLDEYLHREIFEPLGMVDTGYTVAADKLPRYAANYARSPDGGMTLYDDPADSEYARPKTLFTGSSGLISTAADYVRFAEMLRHGGEIDGVRILGPRTVQYMTRNHLPGGVDLASIATESSFSETRYEGVGFGLGFHVVLDPVRTQVPGSAGEYGWGGMASTAFWIDPAEELTVVFMTQLVPSSALNVRAELKSIVYAAIVD